MVKAKHSGVDQKSTATKVPRERKEERHRRYIPSVSFVRKHQLLKNTESAKASNEATGFYPFLCDSCCPKTSIKLKVCGPNLAWNSGPRLLGQETINGRARQQCFYSMGHISKVEGLWNANKRQQIAKNIIPICLHCSKTPAFTMP